MSFTELGMGSRAMVPEHNRLRGVVRTASRPVGVADPHPDKADLRHSHDAAPLGILDYEQTTTDQGAITGVTDLNSLQATATIGENRRIRVRGVIRASNTGANSNLLMITESGVTLQTASYVASTATESLQVEVILTPTPGPHSYRLAADVGGGTMTLRASSTAPAFIVIEDLGAA